MHEIEDAIRALDPVEREKLIKGLPALLTELDGDTTWDRIIGEEQPRPGFTALLDQVENEFNLDLIAADSSYLKRANSV